MKKRTSSIIKLSIIGALLIFGIVISFCSFNFGLTRYNSFASSIKLGLDLKGGIYAVYEATDTSAEDFETSMNGTRTRLENLIISKGYTEATVVREGSTRIRVEVPDVENPSEIFRIIGSPANVEFVLNHTATDSSRQVVITSRDHVKNASAGYYEGQPVVRLELNSEGRQKFGDATTNNIGKAMAIVMQVEGEDEQVISTPNIESAITTGSAIINGMGSYEEAQNLADQIMSGTFDVQLALKESATISATLGDKALMLGLIAGAVGLLLVMAFLCWIYRAFGGVASFCLLIYMVLMLFFLAVLPWVQLTLPGIAGIILSIGMAVDANVVIYERIKYEYRNGKSIMASTHAGFKRATVAIVDSNVTTIIAAVLLLIFGTGSIRGFAVTLLIGIILSLFTSLILTRLVVKWVININSTNPKLYNLKRGRDYADVKADETDVGVQRQIDLEREAKEKEKQEKEERKKAKKAEGELTNENI